MPSSLSAALGETARNAREATAIRSADGALSYGEVADRVEELSQILRVERGERIGILLPNLPQLPLAFHAILTGGGSAVLLNPLSSGREIDEHLRDAGVRRVITAGTLADRVGVAAPLRLEDPGSWRDTPADAERTEAGKDEAVVIHTSAMAGRARGARLSHANLIANARSTVEAMQLSADDVVIAALPWAHLFGLTVTLNAPLTVGATTVPIARFHPARTVDAAVALGGTVMVGVPAMYATMVAVAERRGVPENSLRVAICGGAPLPAPVARRFETLFGIPVRQGYGLTEAGPVCLFNRIDRPNRIGTLGLPFPGVDASVRDTAGGEMDPGEVGELCVRGPNVFLGYTGDSGQRPEDFHGDWLRTGDLASVDREGYFRYRGVLKSMFTRSGFNVYPNEVARALEEDPRIEAARICAAPDAERENEVVLFLTRAPGATLSEEEVRALCKERLATYKQPGRIFVESRRA